MMESTATNVLVAIAALLYIIQVIRKVIIALLAAYTQRCIRAINDLHDRGRQDIETEFDFWWNDGPNQSLETKFITDLPNQGEDIPEEVCKGLVRPVVDEYRKVVFHVAMHARIKSEEDILYGRLLNIGGVRDDAIRHRDEHRKELDENCLQLMRAGLNVDEIMERFIA